MQHRKIIIILLRVPCPYPRGKTTGNRKLKVYVLMDSWYMRRRVISANTRLGFSVIGQVRVDTRLYDLPLPRRHSKLGEVRNMGRNTRRNKLINCIVPSQRSRITAKYNACDCAANLVRTRFLDGKLVHAVWYEFERRNGEWKVASLILSSDITLTSEQVIESYSRVGRLSPCSINLNKLEA